MFNFNYDQGAGNNRCGGYSLAAIATRLKPNENHDPQTVYNNLRDSQVGLGPNSQNLVAGTQQGGTDILLPSTFLAAQYAQLNYELYLNRTTFVREAAPELPNNIDADDIVDEEIATINAQGGHLNQLTVQPDEIGPSLEKFLLDDYVNHQHRYWLVLVLEGRHWIAIERDQNGGYCIYNPAGGINAVANIAGDTIIYNGQVDNWSGIAISVIK